MNIRKRLLSFIICGVMAFSACPLTAFAGDGETGDAIVEETECICETLCDEENINENCPVCSENWENCEGEEPECECEILCTEEEVNGDCPVCSAEGAELDKVCVGAALLLTAPTLRTGEIELYVGGQRITESGCYENKSGTWTKVDGTEPANGQFSYDAATATLTLKGATIQGGTSTGSAPYGAGIYAQCNSGESVSLTIKLISKNTITGYYGIYVNAEISENSNGTDASLTITGENNGSLEVSGSFYGIFVKSGTGNASVTIENASVDAKTTQTNSGYAGVCVQSGASSKDSPNLSLAVNGGSLTTSGSASGDGIQFVVGSHQATGATTNLTVTDNAIVDARNGGISAKQISNPINTDISATDSTGGIVFDGTKGTVYGNVTLQEDLEIGEGESLTIGDGASLTVPNGTTLTNNGTVTTEDGGTLTNNGKIDNSGTLPDKIQGSAPPKITTASLPNGEVNKNYSQSLAATGNGITWSLASGSTLPNGLTLNSDGTISGTPTAAGSSTLTITATNGNGSDSKEFTLSINEETKYSLTVELNGGNSTTTGGQYTKGTEIRIDAGAKSGYRFAGWTSSEGGSFADASSARTTFTMPANDTTITANWKKKSSGGSYSLSEGIDRDEPKDEPEEEPEVEPDAPETDITTDFSDVPAEAWYSEAVDYATENGIMNGVDGNRFEPETELKREMLAVILWNMTDNPEPKGIAPFLDVTSDKYYAKAIAWANENGVMYGYGEEFGVGEAVTREDFAAILYRYAAFKGYDTTQGGMAIREFIDFDQIADYAAEALGWAVNSGIISGMGDGTVSPKTSTYRGQAAVMLMKFCENIMK